MSWTWRLEAANGTILTEQPTVLHQNQSDAESWVGENWQELAAAGAEQVVLLDAGTVVYSMSLAAE